MENNKKNKFGLSDSLIDAVRQVVEKKLDPVDSKELKGKHKDRDDKDIDNDGDVDSSDKFLHKKRKAISKAVAKDNEDDIGEEPNYNKDAVNKAIKKDPRIKGKEAKAIHSLLKGRTAKKESVEEATVDVGDIQKKKMISQPDKDKLAKMRAMLDKEKERMGVKRVRSEASTQKEGGMKRVATGGGLKTFKPKPPAKTEGKKDQIDVKPKMEASELPKK